MAKRGSTKALSVLQEERVARAYGGKRSPSSGGAVTDNGDVRVTAFNTLVECKHTGTYDKPSKSVSVKLSDLEKAHDEAAAEGKMVLVALSMYAPDSVLADRNGFVDLSVRLMRDDANLLDEYYRYRG